MEETRTTPEEGKIVLTSKTNEEDYKALIFFNMFLKKRGMLILLAIAAVVSMAAILCRLTGILPVSNLYFYVCIGFWGLMALQSIVYQSSIKKFLASDKLVIGTEKKIIIDETGITVEGKGESFAVYEWEKLFKGYETRQYFYLYLNTAQALILPKRDLEADEVPVLAKLAEKKLGNRFRSR